MKKKNGFTLIEIIGAIIILGIIAIIAFSVYTNSLKGFRDNYYTNLLRTLEKSGEEFFDDNRIYRPNKVLGAEKVTLSTLQTKNYLSKVVDYNGDSCENSSYVLVVKEGKNDYSYHSCLICNEDGYSSVEDKYCNSSWLDPTKVIYTLGDELGNIEDIYVYIGTTKEELKELLELPVAYTRIDSEGNILRSVRGTGEGEPTILPNNIDVVDTNKEGTYQVVYEYKDERKTRNVIIYESSAPTVTYQNEQERVTVLNNNVTTTTSKENYRGNTWAQNVIVTMNVGQFVDKNVKVEKIQWNKDGRWRDFCETNTCVIDEVDREGVPYSYRLTAKITIEMKQDDVQFRIVDSNGKISKTTDAIGVWIDHTKPTGRIEIETEKGENDWYNQDVVIKLKNIVDQDNDNHIKSGVSKYNIYLSGTEIPSDRSTIGKVDSVTHDTDTAGVTYIGYIEDEAENYNTFEITFKKDATKPECNVSGHADISCTDSLSKINRWYYGKNSSPTYTNITKVSPFSHDASSIVSSSGTYNLYVKDEAGNTSTLKSYAYYDVTYNKNNGTTNPTKASDIIRNGNQADLTPTVTRNGYGFVGWNTNSSATTKLNSYTVSGATALYAIFGVCQGGTISNGTVSCTQCPANTYSNGEGQTSCLACPSGMNSSAGSSLKSDCKITCSAGTYLAKNGTSCTSCPAGKYCAGGTYNFNTSTDQGIGGNCNANTYSEGGASAATCTACGGNLISSAGSTERTQCKAICAAGKYLAKNGTSCTSCPAGKYCAGGTYNFNTSTDQGIGGNCNANTYSTGGASAATCTACGGSLTVAAGSGTDRSKCTITCNAGQYLAKNGTSCSSCPAGKYCSTKKAYGFSSSSDQGITGNCNANTYSTGGASAATCTACGGSLTVAAGSGTDRSKCTITCNAGQYLAKNGTSCSSCPAGKYCSTKKTYGFSSSSDQGITGNCNANTYSTGGATAATCTACGGSLKVAAGSGTDRSKCTITCNAGQYLAKNGTSCSSCPAGKYCSTKKTYGFSSSSDQGITGNCNANTYSTGGATAATCTACGGSLKVAAGSGTDRSKCTITCNAGQYLAKNGTSCSSCPAGKYCSTKKAYGFSSSSDQGITGNCNANTYSTGGASAATCTACGGSLKVAAGSGTDRSKCTITCNAGQYLAKNGTSCSSCPAGKYCSTKKAYGFSSSSDQGITGNCNANTYSTGGATAATCTACPSGTTSVAGSTSSSACKSSFTWKINDTDYDCVSAGGKYCTGFSEGLMYPTSCGYSYLVSHSPKNYGTVQTNRTIGGSCTTEGQMGFATGGTRSYSCSYCSSTCHRISIQGSSGSNYTIVYSVKCSK